MSEQAEKGAFQRSCQAKLVQNYSVQISSGYQMAVWSFDKCFLTRLAQSLVEISYFFCLC